MLTICDHLLPNNVVTYLAFRLACLDTMERIGLAQQLGPEPPEGFGFLTEVPFLQAVPPQVQLDLLSETWCKHFLNRDRLPASLVDEAVVYAACETAARVAEQQPQLLSEWRTAGPRRESFALRNVTADKLRRLNLSLPNEGDFLLVSQFEDLPPFESLALKAEFGLEPRRCDPLFDVLGRWHVTPGIPARLCGLLTDRETAQLVSLTRTRFTCQDTPLS